MVRVSLKDLWKTSIINGLQAASKAFILLLNFNIEEMPLNFFERHFIKVSLRYTFTSLVNPLCYYAHLQLM